MGFASLRVALVFGVSISVLVACETGQPVVSPTSPIVDLPVPPSGVVNAPPEWAVGDRWIFRRRVGLSSSDFTRSVTEVTIGGYLLKAEGRDPFPFVRWQHLTSELDVIGWSEDGEITSAFSPPLPLFRWPLRPSLTWTPQTANGST